MPSCHRDARHRQLSSDGADAAVWGSDGGHQRGSRHRCQLSPVRWSLALNVSLTCVVCCQYVSKALLCAFRVIIHIVSKCHEEGLEHYLRSFIKVTCTASRKSAAASHFFFCFLVFLRFIVHPSCVFSISCPFLFCSMCLWPWTQRQGPQPSLTRCSPWPWSPPSSKLQITISAINCSRWVIRLWPVCTSQYLFSCSIVIDQQGVYLQTVMKYLLFGSFPVHFNMPLLVLNILCFIILPFKVISPPPEQPQLTVLSQTGWSLGYCESNASQPWISLPQYSWFFFETMVKSMAQYLQEGNRMKVGIWWLLQPFSSHLLYVLMQLCFGLRQTRDPLPGPGVDQTHK